MRFVSTERRQVSGKYSHETVVQMKRGKQNLERVCFYLLALCLSVLLSSFKFNRIAVSIFVKRYGRACTTANHLSFLF